MAKRFLYICTHNRCRSIIAECITNKLAAGRIKAASAGSQASGEVHPLTLKFLQEKGFSCDQLKSQSWDEYEHYNANCVVTMCDQAAAEACPTWFSSIPTVHWGLPDPSKISENEELTRAAFYATIDEISQRVNNLLRQDFETLTDQELAHVLRSLS